MILSTHAYIVHQNNVDVDVDVDLLRLMLIQIRDNLKYDPWPHTYKLLVVSYNTFWKVQVPYTLRPSFQGDGI